MRARALPAGALQLFAALAACLPCACGNSASRELDTRAVVIGIDGADWRVIDPLIAEGGMPNLARLIGRGVRGDIETLNDIPLSPVIWTSVATGKVAAKHGVTWFLVDQPDGTRAPVRSTNRQAEAVWNIVDRAELSCAVVGWWATYPAEPLEHGLVISDALGFHGFGSTARDASNERKVAPSSQFARWDALMPVEQQVSFEFVHRFIDIGEADYRAERYDPARNTPRELSNPIHLFQQYAVTAQGYTSIAEQLLEQDDHDLCLFYFEQVDSLSHLFMKYAPPRLPWVDDAGFQRYQRVVREWYRYQDEELGRLLAHVDLGRTAVFVLSDHGFKSGERRIRSERTVDIRKAHLDHETHGIFVAAGPHIRAGARVDGASVLDVTPTVLHYLGLPIGKDMDGKVLESLFEPAFVQRFPVRYVATHETGKRARAAGTLPSDTNTAEVTDALRTLGYVGDETPASSSAPANAASSASSPELHNNLGRILLAKGQVESALAEFEQALQLAPNDAETLLNIGRAHQSVGRTELALRFAERALASDPNSVGALAQLADVRRDRGELDEAVRLYRAAVELDDSQPGLFTGLGDVLQRAGRYAEAEQALRHALELDPDSFDARYDLGVTYTQMGRSEDAAAMYGKALELDARHPLACLALNNLGALHRAAGRVDQALDCYERAAAASPTHVESRFNAAMIYLERGRVNDAIASLEQAAALQPNHEQIQVQLGLAYLRDGRADDAARCFSLVRRLYPQNWTAAIGLAAVRAAAGDVEQARALLADGVRLGGDEARSFAAGFAALAALR